MKTIIICTMGNAYLHVQITFMVILLLLAVQVAQMDNAQHVYQKITVKNAHLGFMLMVIHVLNVMLPVMVALERVLVIATHVLLNIGTILELALSVIFRVMNVMGLALVNV